METVSMDLQVVVRMAVWLLLLAMKKLFGS